MIKCMKRRERAQLGAVRCTEQFSNIEVPNKLVQDIVHVVRPMITIATTGTTDHRWQLLLPS